MKITITFDSGDTHWFSLSKSAAALVRAEFNPSGKLGVDTIKALAAGLITGMEETKAANPAAARHASLAITAIEEGAMWAVKAATT